MRLTAHRARQEAESQAEPPAPDAAATPKQPSGAPKVRDPVLAFTRLANVVRQAMILETQVASGPIHAGRQRRRPPPDPRRDLLRAAFEEGTERHPERKRLLRESLERVEEELAADPQAERTANDIVGIICQDLGFALNMAMVSDETLVALTGIPIPDYSDEPDPYGPDPPDDGGG